MANPRTAPVKTGANALAIPKPTALLDTSAYASYAGQGFENQNREDVALPFFDILHFVCPQMGVVPGAEPGLVINKASNKIYKQITFIPATTQHEYLEWIPLDDGGGLVGTHALDSDLVKEARRASRFATYKMQNGHELAETFTAFGVVIGDDDEAPMPGVISFTSTRIKAYKQWMFNAQSQYGRRPDGSQFQMPLFAYQWVLKSQMVEKKPYKWFVWEMAFKGGSAAAAQLAPDDPLFLQAAALAASVNAGTVKADMSQSRPIETGDAPADAGSNAAPF